MTRWPLVISFLRPIGSLNALAGSARHNSSPSGVCCDQTCVAGWVDNFNAATGVLAGAGKGILRTAFIKRECVADIVPVDLCINLMCVLAWKTASSPSSSIPVYNCTSGAVNTLTWGLVEKEGLKIIRNHPYSGVLWYPGGSFKENHYTNRICQVGA